VSEEERAWERARQAILRRLADPTEENAADARRRLDELVDVAERPKERAKAA
jgi:hypothetical protein